MSYDQWKSHFKHYNIFEYFEAMKELGTPVTNDRLKVLGLENYYRVTGE